MIHAVKNEINAVLDDLRGKTGASRVTLRQDRPGEYAFPVTHESLAPGVPSLREERTVDLKTQPVVALLGKGQQVVQNDSRAAFDDPVYQNMLDTYGSLAAQIVTPIVREGRLVAIVSLHQLGNSRRWTEGEIAAASLTAQRIAELL
jgi:GAF domain-containing protein